MEATDFLSLMGSIEIVLTLPTTLIWWLGLKKRDEFPFLLLCNGVFIRACAKYIGSPTTFMMAVPFIIGFLVVVIAEVLRIVFPARVWPRQFAVECNEQREKRRMAMRGKEGEMAEYTGILGFWHRYVLDLDENKGSYILDVVLFIVCVLLFILVIKGIILLW